MNNGKPLRYMVYFGEQDSIWSESPNIKDLHPNYVQRIEKEFEIFSSTPEGKTQLLDAFEHSRCKLQLTPGIKARILFLINSPGNSDKFRMKVVDDFISQYNEMIATFAPETSRSLRMKTFYFPLDDPKIEDAEYYSASYLKNFLFNIFSTLSDQISTKDTRMSYRIYETYVQTPRLENTKPNQMTVYVVNVVLLHLDTEAYLNLMESVLTPLWREVLSYATIDENKALRITLTETIHKLLKHVCEDIRFDWRASS
jgi:hypothetical protein